MLFRLIFLLGLLFYPSTLAQSFHFGVLATNTLLIEPEIQISNLTFEDSKLSMRLAGGVSDPLEFGLGLRNTTTLGPLGNVIIMATANIKSDASFELSSNASGVIGPVAARLSASLFNSPGVTFDLQSRYTNDSVNLLASNQLAGTLSAGVRYRIERNLVIDAETGFIYQDQKGWGGSITSNLSFLKIINRDDGIVHLRSYASPAFKESFAALGFAYDLNQRNLPSFVGELSLGYGTNGFWPGVRLSYSQRLSEMEARVSAELAVEPYVVAQLPIRGYATYEQDLDAGKLISTLGLGFEEGQTEGFLKLEYQIALEQLNFE